MTGLCAQWCGVCREWRAAFDAAATARPGDRFEWIDVEDESEVMGDVDVETFPTLLVSRDASVLFYGTVLPKAEMLLRLLTSLETGTADGGTLESRGLLQRISERKL